MNQNYNNVKLKKIVFHQIGNITTETETIFSKDLCDIESELISENIIELFFSNISKEGFNFKFDHISNVELNESYIYSKEIFDNNDTFYNNSINFTKHLLESSKHHNILKGDLIIGLFENFILNDKVHNVLGIIKVERLEPFLLNKFIEGKSSIRLNKGISLGKIDKGCLIVKSENDFHLAIIDKSTNSRDIQFWKQNFLRVKPISNEYNNTKNFLGLTKQFVTSQLTEDFEISKADQIDLLNNSINYFKSHDYFDKNEFEAEIFVDDKVIESFNKFNEIYRQQNDEELLDNFEISTPAVKKQARAFKSVLKLDKNFHIYIHGDRDLIEQGIDENGRKYYKIYYKEEN